MAAGSRSSSSSRASRDSLPMYKTQNLGLASDYINVGPPPTNDIKQEEYQTQVGSSRSSINYLPPPFPPPGFNEEEVKPSFWKRHGHHIKWTLGFVTMVLICAALLYPVFKFRTTEQWTEEETPEMSDRQMQYHIFLWLFISWINLLFWWVVASAFPHVFRFVAGFVNPGQQKYWHIFRYMNAAITLLGGSIGLYIAYVIVRQYPLKQSPG